MDQGRDNWPEFLKLTSVVLVRSIVFFGLSSFLALYFIHNLGTTEVVGGAALTIFLASGACGTLLGGWLADRFGPLISIRYGFGVCIPAMVGLVLAVTVGGLFNPVLGAIADATSLHTMLVMLIALPALALFLSLFLRTPASSPPTIRVETAH